MKVHDHRSDNRGSIVEVSEEPIISRKLAVTIINNFAYEGIEDITVIITDKDYEKAFSFVKTKKDGKFSFIELKEANYSVLICKPGYRPIRFIIKLKTDGKEAPEPDELKLSAAQL